MTLERRLADLERRAEQKGAGPCKFIIIRYDGRDREVWAIYTAGVRAPDGGLCVEVGEGETAQDAIGRFTAHTEN